MTLTHINLNSRYIGGNTDVNILLPGLPRSEEAKEFYTSGRKYPVLWLLHGTEGDYTSWMRFSCVERYAEEKNIIVVMPSFQNTNYADWPTFANGYDAYSLLTEELMPLVHGWFPAGSAREDNFIAGYSMGGRGALIYAYNHPEKFAGAYVMSASAQDMRTHLDDPFFAKRNRNMVANCGSMEAFLRSPQNIWDLTRAVVEEKRELPALYFSCGTEDQLAYPDYCTFRSFAHQLGLKAQFTEVPGYRHEPAFWDLCLKDAMEKFFPDRN